MQRNRKPKDLAGSGSDPRILSAAEAKGAVVSTTETAPEPTALESSTTTPAVTRPETPPTTSTPSGPPRVLPLVNDWNGAVTVIASVITGVAAIVLHYIGADDLQALAVVVI